MDEIKVEAEEKIPLVCYCCEKCGATFDKKFDLYRHQKLHEKEQSFVICYICGNCKKIFSRKYHLTRHLKIHTKNPKPKECENCKKIFTGSINLLENQGDFCKKCAVLFRKFTCVGCNKTFSRKYGLSRHMRGCVDHEMFECAYCSKHFSRKDALLLHVRTFHGFGDNAEEKVTFDCNYCGKVLSRKSVLRRHIRKIHSLYGNFVSDNVFMVHKETFECSFCDRSYLNNDGLKKHIKAKHLEPKRHPLDIREGNVKCALCGYTCNTERNMHYHYEVDHEIPIEREDYAFFSREEFDTWKEDQENVMHCNFIRRRAYALRKQSCVVFICHRSGEYKSKATKRRLKLTGSKKINGICPCTIELKEDFESGLCRVSFIKTHIGHPVGTPDELAYMFLSKSKKREIAQKISAGFSYKKILEEYAVTGTGGDKLTRLSLINKKDVFNTAKSFSLKPQSSRTHSRADPIDVQSFVQENEPLILYYKQKGAVDDRIPELNKSDMILILMSPKQKEMLFRNCANTVAVDRTNNYNNYDYTLQTLLVMDDYDEGCAVAFAVSNRTDDETITSIFLTFIREEVGVLHPKVLMTDIQSFNYECWKIAFNETVQKLFCIWHVHEEWRKNLTKVRDSEKRKNMKCILQDLSKERDLLLFHEKMHSFRYDDDEDAHDFLQYFNKNYVDNMQLWALCYRLNLNTNTNVKVEALHNQLRYWYTTNRKKTFRVENGLGLLVKYLVTKDMDLTCREIRGQITTKLQTLRRYHNDVEKLTDIRVENTENENLWLVQSAVGGNDDEQCAEMHYLERMKPRCDYCPLLCEKCDICAHEFRCSCVESSVKGNMCQHVHMLGLNFVSQTKTNSVVPKQDFTGEIHISLSEVVMKASPLKSFISSTTV